MASAPLKIQMLGLLPAILKPCGPTCAQPFMNGTSQRLSREEMDEAPAFVRENGERIHSIAEQLFRDFGRDVRIEVVGLDSPRGMLIAARYRIGKGFAVVVGGRHVVRDPEAYEPVRAAVARALGGRETAAP